MAPLFVNMVGTVDKENLDYICNSYITVYSLFGTKLSKCTLSILVSNLFWTDNSVWYLNY